MGVPILLKDIIDATPMYTTAGDWALRESFPEKDSGVARNLRAHGVVILGKLGLSEWANSFGSQPSGFSNVTGQVLNANDAAEGPSGSSSGSGAAEAAGLVTLTIGTETGWIDHQPVHRRGDRRAKPTLGLVPGFGIAPIDVSRDTAGPMEKTVADAALTLQSLAEVPGTDAEATKSTKAWRVPNFLKNGDILPAPFTDGARLHLGADDELRQRQAHRLQQHDVHDRTAGDHVHAEPDPGSRPESGHRSGSRGRDHGARRTDDCGKNAQSAERLRGARDDRRVLQAPRLQSAGPEPRGRGRSGQHQPAGGARRTATPATRKSPKPKTSSAAKTRKNSKKSCRREKKATQAAIEKMMNEPSGGGGPGDRLCRLGRRAPRRRGCH